MKRFFFLALLFSFSSLYAQSGDSLRSTKQRHFDVGARAMVVFGKEWPLRTWRPGLNLSFGAMKSRKNNRFTDWEFHVGGMHMESIPLPAYECSDPRVFHAGPIPCRFVGFYTYKYHFTNLAYQYKFGQLKKRKRSDFFWSAGGSLQMNFIRSYSPLRIPKGFYAYGSEVNEFGNIAWLQLSYPALAAVFETGIATRRKKGGNGLRISVFGEAQFTPSGWDIPKKNTIVAFPLMAGIRVGFFTAKNKPAEKKAVVEKSPNSNPVIIYAEAFGPGGWGSGNVEFKMTESSDSLFTLNLRTGIGVLEAPGVIAGFYEVIGKGQCRFDIGEGIAFTDGDPYLFLSVGFRYTSRNGFFIRPAFTPLFGFYNRQPFGGLSVGYAFPVKQK